MNLGSETDSGFGEVSGLLRAVETGNLRGMGDLGVALSIPPAYIGLLRGSDLERWPTELAGAGEREREYGPAGVADV